MQERGESFQFIVDFGVAGEWAMECQVDKQWKCEGEEDRSSRKQKINV